MMCRAQGYIQTWPTRPRQKIQREQVKKHGVHEKVEEEVCWEVTGKGPIGTTWIDIHKGHYANPEILTGGPASQFSFQRSYSAIGHAKAIILHGRLLA
eukprot:55860-Pyramimonas_sp.AAC.1